MVCPLALAVISSPWYNTYVNYILEQHIYSYKGVSPARVQPASSFRRNGKPPCYAQSRPPLPFPQVRLAQRNFSYDFGYSCSRRVRESLELMLNEPRF